MTSKNRSWGCCSNADVGDDQYIECTSCKQLYHIACLATSSFNRNSKTPSNWKCPACTNSAPKPTKQDSTPVHSGNAPRSSKRPALASPESTSAGVTSAEVRAIVLEVVKSEFSSMVKELNNNMVNIVNKQLAPLKQVMQDIQDSMTFMNSRFEDIEVEQADTKKKMIDLHEENQKMRSEINDLNRRLNNCEQLARGANLELQCVPEHKQENIITIVRNLATTVGCTLNDSSLVHCTRTAKNNNDSKRPRSIVLQLASPRLRNELLAATICFNKANPQDKLNSSHLGIGGEKTPVYLVEHLSPANKALHGAARKQAKEHGYKYVWVRDGKIYARKTDESEYIYIRNMDSLKKIL